jgi:SAM-dependent methyltransferase
MDKTYLPKLARLAEISRAMPRTRMLALARINALVVLNMRYERIQIDRRLLQHPYVLVERLVDDAIATLVGWHNIAFIESPESAIDDLSSAPMETMHQDLFQRLWTQFDADEYVERIERYQHRLAVNGLAGAFVGLRGMDFGCGHGNFAHAFIRSGAAFVLGVDYGEDSISFATRARDRLDIGPDRILFKMANVYDTREPSESYDFAVQNGVFHHLDDEDSAYREVHRILRPGGLFWVYTDGSGAISHDLWDVSREILADLPASFVINQLESLNISTGKRYHLGDGLNAVYRHTTWEELIGRLARLGFGDFRRLVGGFPTDFDHDAIAADPFGAAKFGSGDLRVLCKKGG